ncbi:hypothetical protein [Spirosoma pomorum]|jgi:hypothetical protein
MGAIRLIQKPQNGQITFTVPEEMRDETIVIEFHPVREDTSMTLTELSNEFFSKLERKKIDFDESDFNVYEQ